MNVFPVTESTLSAKELGVLLQRQYSLSNDVVCTLFRTGMNHLYMVSDSVQQYVFRVYTHNWRSKTEIAEELRLLLHLRDNKVAVSYPIPGSDGGYIQELNAPEGLRYGVLFSFAEGRKNPKFSPEASYHIGVAMANMHKAAENFHLDRITYNTSTLLHDALIRTKKFFNKALGEMGFVEALTNYLFEEYRKVNEHELRHGALHLDAWFDNIHLTEDNRITFFDFDFCGNGWLCHDISYFLYQLFSTNPGEQEYEAKAEQFLKGYETITKIPAEEKRVIPFVCLGVMVFYLGMQCEKYDTWSNIFLNEDHLKRFTASLERWCMYNQLSVI